MIVYRFAPRIDDSSSAASVFSRRSFRVPAAAELMHLPFAFFRYEAEFRGIGGSRKSFAGCFLADLVRGEAMNVPLGTRVEVEPALQEEFSHLVSGAIEDNMPRATLVRIESTMLPDSQLIPPSLAVEEAIARSRSVLKYDLMRLAGGLRYRDFSLAVLPGAKIVYYPLWVVYYRRRGGAIGFAVVDALTGRPDGTGLSVSLAQGLVRKESLETRLETSKGGRFI